MTEAEVEVEGPQEPASEAESTHESEVDDGGSELERLQKEASEMRELAQRKQAEFENYRKRMDRERGDLARYAGADIVKEVPTTKEGGLGEVQASSWNAIFAPANLPKGIQARLNDAVVKALDDPGTRKRLQDIGSVVPDAADRTPQALQTLVEGEVPRWSSVLKAAGVTAN